MEHVNMFRRSQHLLYFALLYVFFFDTTTSFRFNETAVEPEVYVAVVGSKVTFHCTLNANHSLYQKINWLIEGKPIDFNTKSRFVNTGNSSLIITKTIASDAGIYTCLASTETDNATASYRLILREILSIPKPPELLQMLCHEKRAMLVWISDEDNGIPILHYLIEYSSSFTPGTWSIASKQIPPSAKTYYVPLAPWTSYTFRVIAINKIGRSNPSLPSDVCSTRPDVPYNNPEGVAAASGDHSHDLVISWTPMPPIEHNGPGFVYRVCWKKDIPGEDWNCEVITDYTKHELVIKNQQKYQSYKVKVVARNIVGDSKAHQIEVVGFLGIYDKDKSGILYTLKWLITMFLAGFFFFIILFLASSLCLQIMPDKRAYDVKSRRDSSRRNNRSLLRYLGYPHSFWVSSIGANVSGNDQHSTAGSAYSLTDYDDKEVEEQIDDIINEDTSFCDLLQTNVVEIE